MGLRWVASFIFLVFFIIYARTDAVTTVADTGARFLRTNQISNNVNNSDGAERAGLSVPVADKIKSIFSSSKVTADQLQTWLNKGKSADSVFARMHLNKAKDKLLYYDEFADWLKYVDDLSARNPRKQLSAISTLAKQYDDADLYKTIQAAAKVPRLKSIAARLQTEQMQYWLTAGKTPDDVFHFMKLGKVKYDFLGNPMFSVWAKYVDDFNAKYPDRFTTMVPVLTKYISNDITLFRVAETAKSVEGTKSIATKLGDQLVEFLLDRRKSPDDALEDLGLSYSVYSLLDSPLFDSWAKYTNAYSVKYPQEKVTVIEALTQRFGDAKVSRMLAVAKTSYDTRDVATKLGSAQLEMWYTSGKSADDVMLLLMLQSKIDFTDNPLLLTWVSYMDKLLKASSDKVTTMLSKLETRFDDRPMNQILLAAKQFPSMDTAALAIQAKKIKGYLANNQSPVKTFKLLALDNVGENLLGDRVFQMWMKYVKDFNKKNPKTQESWFMPIRMMYNPSVVDQMISVAMQNERTKSIDNVVVRERSKYWLDTKEIPLQIFRNLRLDDTGETTLTSPNFRIWANYLNAFNQRYRNDKTTMIDGFRASYNDINLLTILAAAKKDPKTEKLATNLESALVNTWVAEKEPLAGLTKRFGHVPSSSNLLKRYVAKLDALSTEAA